MSTAAFHRLRQRKGRHRQVDDGRAYGYRAGRIRPSGRSARPRQPPAHHDPLSREPRRHHAPARNAAPHATYEVLEDHSEEGARPRRSSAWPTDADVIVIDTPGRDDPIARAAILKADTLGHPDERQLRRSRPHRPGSSRELQDHAPELLRRADLEQPHGTRQANGQGRRLGGAQNPPPAYRIAQSPAASAPRSTSLRAASASGLSPASASASSTASCSPRA